MALWPLHCKYGIKRMIVSTYQAASGAGAEGIEELQKGIAEHVAGGTPVNKVFPHPLPFNLIPHIDKFQPNRYTKEEMKVAWETRKIFHADIAVSCTAVRVPTLRAHAEALTIEFARDVQAEAAAALILDAPGCELVDNPAAAQYPMPINASNKHKVEVGRLRQSLVFGDRGEYRLQTISFFYSRLSQWFAPGAQWVSSRSNTAVLVCGLGQVSTCSSAATSCCAAPRSTPCSSPSSSRRPCRERRPCRTRRSLSRSRPCASTRRRRSPRSASASSPARSSA